MWARHKSCIKRKRSEIGVVESTKMEDFEKKVKISEDVDDGNGSLETRKTLELLRSFLRIQQRRAQAYSRLKSGFADYMVSGLDSAYQQLCSEITVEFNDCSKQIQEKKKLNLTATIQVLKKAGHPSERLVSHENCKFKEPMQHECVHVHEITESAGTEEAEADAEYDNALKEAIKGVQDAVIAINEYLEEIRYEIAALEDR